MDQDELNKNFQSLRTKLIECNKKMLSEFYDHVAKYFNGIDMKAEKEMLINSFHEE